MTLSESMASAILRDDITEVRALLTRRADVNQVSERVWRGPRGQPPLHLAAWRGRLDILQALLQAGADVGRANTNRWVPLYLSACRGKLGCLRALLAAGAEVHQVDWFGWTPLHGAAEGGHPACVRALLVAHADAGLQDKKGNIALDLAIEEDSAKLLIVESPAAHVTLIANVM